MLNTEEESSQGGEIKPAREAHAQTVKFRGEVGTV